MRLRTRTSPAEGGGHESLKALHSRALQVRLEATQPAELRASAGAAGAPGPSLDPKARTCSASASAASRALASSAAESMTWVMRPKGG